MQAQNCKSASALGAILFHGQRPAPELRRLAKKDGICETTLLRAKTRLGIVSKRTDFGTDGKWQWVLPWQDEEGEE